MTTNNQINLDASLDEIIEAKRKYHVDQLAFHKSQIDLLNKSQNGRTVNSSLNGSELHNDKEIISQKTAKPLVLEFLKNNNGRYTTDEIFKGIKPEIVNDRELRAKWVQAISLSLNSLVTYHHANSYPHVGRTKKYILKEYDTKQNE